MRIEQQRLTDAYPAAALGGDPLIYVVVFIGRRLFVMLMVPPLVSQARDSDRRGAGSGAAAGSSG